MVPLAVLAPTDTELLPTAKSVEDTPAPAPVLVKLQLAAGSPAILSRQVGSATLLFRPVDADMIPLMATLELEALEGTKAAVMADTASRDSPTNEYFFMFLIFGFTEYCLSMAIVNCSTKINSPTVQFVQWGCVL